jgi:hypothetical protein
MVNLIVGLICLALGAWGVTAWWNEFGAALRGLLPVVFLLVGLAAVGAGMRKKAACKPEVEDEDQATSNDDALAGHYRKAG